MSFYLEFPSDIRQNILYRLPCVTTHRYSQVAKGCLADVVQATKQWQYDINFSGKITIINFEEKDQIIKTLLLQKLKVETLAPYFAELFTRCGDEARKKFLLENHANPSEITQQSLPFLSANVIFDLITRKHTSADLRSALEVLFDEGVLLPEELQSTYKVVQPLFVKAILCHPNAKDIPAKTLSIVLLKTAGIGYNYMRSQSMTPSGIVKVVTTLCVAPPKKMLEARLVSDCRIPKLVFSHPKSSEMNLIQEIEPILLCAVRNRNPTLVQMALNHPAAKSLPAENLKDMLTEAEEADEKEIVQAFKDKI